MTDRTRPITGTLYVVATPIGNLEDMTPRAIAVLKRVQRIACEDTRHSSRLMSHFAIDTPMLAYHDHSDTRRTEQILAHLCAGEEIALISDAGTPLVSDPGYRLVHDARAAGVTIVPVPGACALIAGLSAAGLPSDRFAFEGFLPARAGARQKRLESLVAEQRTLIFYEAPHRVLDSLLAMREVFGPERPASMARELTKAFETIYSAPLTDLVNFVASDTNQQRGEIVLMLAGAPGANTGMDAEAIKVMQILLDDLPVKQAAALGARLTGVKKNELYQWALTYREGE